MKGIRSLLATDTRLLVRNGFLVVMGISLAVTAASVHLIPDVRGREGTRYVLDLLPTGSVVPVLAGQERTVVVADREELDRRIREDTGATGVILGEAVRIVTLGPLSTERERIITAAVGGSPTQTPLRVLDPGARRLGNRDRTAVILIAYEIAILGFLFVSVLLVQEKQEGVIHAYRVSPAGSLVYVVSKGAFWTVATVLYGVLFLLATGRGIRLSPDRWLLMLGLFALAGAFMTHLGLLVATFFRSLSSWFFPGIGLLILNMLPCISFAVPSFSPVWIRAIPSYHLLFAARDVLFGVLDTARMGATFALFGALAAGFFGASWAAVRFRLLGAST